MSRDRRGRRAEPPSLASDAPLAPGPFEELFLKPSRPLDLDAAGAGSRDVFSQQPAAGTTAAEGERESVIYSPFSPAAESPPAFPQPPEPPPITMETGDFKPAPRSFEELVQELLPVPGENDFQPRTRRRVIPLAAWVAGAVLLLASGTAFLLRERLTAIFSSSPAGVVAATAQVDQNPATTLAAQPGDHPAELPTAPVPENPAAVGDPEPVAPAPAAEQLAPSQPGSEPATPDKARTQPLALPPAATLTGVSWQTTAAGTEVIITGDGVFAPASVRVNALAAPPRVLVRLARVRPGAAGEQRAVGTREVERIRFGYHGELSPPELYVVLDLPSPSVSLAGHTVDGDAVRLNLQRAR